MIVRRLEVERGTERCVTTEGWRSIRLLLKDDGMGFSFHITTIYAGAVLRLHYINHREAVYCVAGRGLLEALDDGQLYLLQPGTFYALDRQDPHMLRAETDLLLACVFTPALVGKEVHDASGSYPAAPLAT